MRRMESHSSTISSTLSLRIVLLPIIRVPPVFVVVVAMLTPLFQSVPAYSSPRRLLCHHDTVPALRFQSGHGHTVR
jgi:hypothetical protein